MTDIRLVARREIFAQIRTRAYLIGLIFSAVVITAIIALPQLLSSDSSYDVALVGPDGSDLESALTHLAAESGSEVVISTDMNEDSARESVSDGDLDAAIIGSETVLTDGDLDPQFEALVQGAHRSVVSQQQLTAAGLDPQQVQAALEVAPLEQVSVTGDTRYDDARSALAFITIIVLYFLIIYSAMYVAIGVVEEKSSRIVEILLIAVRPWQLLAGKISAFLALGLIQLVVLAGAGVGTAAAIGILPDLPPGTPGILATALFGFVLGFLFYAAMAAALASLVSRQEELNSVLNPMLTAIMASFFVGIWAANSPNSTVSEALSMIPPFSAMVMPVRVAAGDVAGWQVGVAVAGMIAAVAGMLYLGGRIYERAVLRTGARVKFTEVLRRDQAAA